MLPQFLVHPYHPGATLNGVFYPRTAAEVLALDVLHRSNWKPVSRDVVQDWFEDRSRHGCACQCWRGEAAAKAGVDRVWRCLRAWRRTTTVAPMAGIDPRPLPEQARMLRDAGLTMQEVADELGCSVGTVHRHMHSA